MALITTLVMSLVLVGIVSLVVDLGLARDTRRQAQEAADSAALAAANFLYLRGANPDYTRAVAAAKDYALKNFAVPASAWAGCSDSGRLPIRPGGTSCISFRRSTTQTQVRVSIPERAVATPFAGIWDIDHVDVGAAAQATVTTRQMAPCGVCVIGGGNHDLNGAIEVGGADIAVNGDLTGTGSVTATGGGDITLQGLVPGGIVFSPSPPQAKQPPLADPLAYQNMPDYGGLINKSDPCSQGPGIYAGMAATGPTCTMLPGLYVFIGDVASSTRSIVADGVTMYFTCSFGSVPFQCGPGERGPGLRLTEDATLFLRAPTNGPRAGLALVSSRENTSEFSWRGNGTDGNSGTIYIRSGSLDYGGNLGGPPMDSLVVVGDYQIGRHPDFGGNRRVAESTYSAGANVVIPTGSIYLSR